MLSKSRSFTLGLLFLTIIVSSTVSMSKGHSQQAGQPLPTNQRESLILADQLYTETSSFIEKMQQAPSQEALVQIFNENIRKLQNLAEQYFKSANISFAKVPAKLELGTSAAKVDHVLSYDTYQIRGSQQGDRFSRTLNGIDAYSKKNNQNVRLIFDPLYAINFQGSFGHFDPRKNSLTFGSSANYFDSLGMTKVLRHEIQHYFEQLKIVDGKQTLARAVFFNDRSTDHTPYNKHLRADEAETHLRDLRSFASYNKDSSLEKVLQNMPAEFYKSVASQRARGYLQEYRTADDLIRKMSETLSTLTIHDFADMSVSKDELSVMLELKKGHLPYTRLILNLTGLITAEEFSDINKIKSAIQQTIRWQLARNQEIQKEITSLHKNNGYKFKACGAVHL